MSQQRAALDNSGANAYCLLLPHFLGNNADSLRSRFTPLRSSVSEDCAHGTKNHCVLSWLGQFLTQRGVSSELGRFCEEKLVFEEGFGSPTFLMRVNVKKLFFHRTYLTSLGITSLGVCEALLSLHEDLSSAFVEQCLCATSLGPVEAARAATKIVFPGVQSNVFTNAMYSHELSWLGAFLTKNGLSADLIRLCEETLVQQEGFGSPLILARTTTQYFHRNYLNELGITQLGLREGLLVLHSDLHNAFNKHAKGMRFNTSNGAEDAARAAVNAVLPGYLENSNNESIDSSDGGADGAGGTAILPTTSASGDGECESSADEQDDVGSDLSWTVT